MKFFLYSPFSFFSNGTCLFIAVFIIFKEVIIFEWMILRLRFLWAYPIQWQNFTVISFYSPYFSPLTIQARPSSYEERLWLVETIIYSRTLPFTSQKFDQDWKCSVTHNHKQSPTDQSGRKGHKFTLQMLVVFFSFFFL